MKGKLKTKKLTDLVKSVPQTIETATEGQSHVAFPSNEK